MLDTVTCCSMNVAMKMVGKGCSQPQRRFIVSDGLDRKDTPYDVDALQ